MIIITRCLKSVLIFSILLFIFLFHPVVNAKDWHYKSEGNQSHIARSIECTKGHVKFLLEIDLGKWHTVHFIVDAVLKGMLWDLPPAILRDLKLLED